MHRYIVNRVLLVIPTLIGAAALVFVLMRLIPGDICVVRLGSGGGNVDPRAVALCHAELGLDRPVIVQFLDFVWGFFRLDFGISMWSGKPVAEEIAARLPISLEIAVMATVVAILIAIPLGTVGVVLVVVMAAAGLSAEWIAPYNPTSNDFAAMTEPPSWAHLMGTDQFGRDLFSRIVAFSPGFVVSRTPTGKPKIFITHGTGDTVLPIDQTSRVIVPALRNAGYDVEYHEFAGGHAVPSDLLPQAVTWASAS